MKTSKIISNLSISLSVINLFILIFYCCFSKIDNIMPSLLISVLGILITVLIGWQIYQSIQFEKKILEYKKDVLLTKCKMRNLSVGMANFIIGKILQDKERDNYKKWYDKSFKQISKSNEIGLLTEIMKIAQIYPQSQNVKNKVSSGK